MHSTASLRLKLNFAQFKVNNRVCTKAAENLSFAARPAPVAGAPICSGKFVSRLKYLANL